MVPVGRETTRVPLCRVAGRLGVGPLGEGGRLVQHLLGAGDHGGAAHGVEALAAGGAAGLGQGVGAVERVVQAAPAGVGGVQGVAGVHHGHDELRAGDGGDFRIDAGCVDLKRFGLGQQVADAAEELGVGGGVVGVGALAGVPGVDLRLQGVAPG